MRQQIRIPKSEIRMMKIFLKILAAICLVIVLFFVFIAAEFLLFAQVFKPCSKN